METHDSACLYVGDLSIRCMSSDLELLFGGLDGQGSVEVKLESGFAFVLFPFQEAAQNALNELQGFILHGRKLRYV